MVSAGLPLVHKVFDAGANEVWLCAPNGGISFLGPKAMQSSRLCSAFPKQVQLRSLGTSARASCPRSHLHNHLAPRQSIKGKILSRLSARCPAQMWTQLHQPVPPKHDRRYPSGPKSGKPQLPQSPARWSIYFGRTLRPNPSRYRSKRITRGLKLSGKSPLQNPSTHPRTDFPRNHLPSIQQSRVKRKSNGVL